MKIHIERLTVEGSSPLAADQLATALREHLTTGTASIRPSALQAATIDRVDAGRVDHGTSMRDAGGRIANGIFHQLKGGSRG